MNRDQILSRLLAMVKGKDSGDSLKAEVLRLAADLTEEGVTADPSYHKKNFPFWLRQELITSSRCVCGYCNREGTPVGDPDGDAWEVDHVIPSSRGGLTILGNAVLSCRKCNNEKSDMTSAEYVLYLQSRTPVKNCLSSSNLSGVEWMEYVWDRLASNKFYPISIGAEYFFLSRIVDPGKTDLAVLTRYCRSFSIMWNFTVSVGKLDKVIRLSLPPVRDRNGSLKNVENWINLLTAIEADLLSREEFYNEQT